MQMSSSEELFRSFFRIFSEHLKKNRLISEFISQRQVLINSSKNWVSTLVNTNAAIKEMAGLMDQVNKFYQDHPVASGQPMSVQEVALGFIDVANEAMCRAIRSITQGRGHDTSKHTLACFGGAGGQHACAIAKKLGVF
ncbi:unnamed protein product, partial [Gongylonema pulchrum]|uniref:Hydantoinase_A domain-containing protein n=1 Tax=Gongylonema pulchrum TaxID=637853 RepID=A0A183DEK3_9BILA